MLKRSDLTEQETAFFDHTDGDESLKLAIIELKRLGGDPGAVLRAEIILRRQFILTRPVHMAAA